MHRLGYCKHGKKIMLTPFNRNSNSPLKALPSAPLLPSNSGKMSPTFAHLSTALSSSLSKFDTKGGFTSGLSIMA